MPASERELAGASLRAYVAVPSSAASSRQISPGSRPRRAVISAASNAAAMSSLFVVHTVPSWRRNEAPAFCSPAKPSDASRSPCQPLGEVKAKALGNMRPVMHARAAERIDTHRDVRRAYDVEVDDAREVTRVGVEKIVSVCRRRAKHLGVRDAFHAPQARFGKAVFRSLNPVGDFRARRPAVRGVVLESPVLGRVVRGRHDDAAGQALAASTVMGQDRVRDHWRRREFILICDHRFHFVRGEHFEGVCKRRYRQRVGVDVEAAGLRSSARGGNRRSPERSKRCAIR